MSLLTGSSRADPSTAEPGAATTRRLRLAFTLGVAAVCGGVWIGTDGLSFEPIKDEQQFWDQVRTFAAGWPPSVSELRSYDEPMTPLAFLVWAALEVWHGGGMAAARLATLAASLVVVFTIALQRPAPSARPETPVLAALALLLFPYWPPTSVLVYTDVPAAFFTVGGFFFYVRGHRVTSAAVFALAIATRQYMVTFPVAIAAYEGFAAWRARDPAVSRWLPFAVSAATLLGWFAFFGGFGPAPGLAKWPRHSEALVSVEPAFALYALAALGAYFVAVEFVIDRGWRRLPLRADRNTRIALVAAVALFAVSTPYYPTMIGPLNRGLDFLLGSEGLGMLVRIALLLGLLLATVARFARPGLGTWVVAANVGIMPFLWAPWEKYTMPTIASLWFLKAAGALDRPPTAAGPAASGDDPAP